MQTYSSTCILPYLGYTFLFILYLHPHSIIWIIISWIAFILWVHTILLGIYCIGIIFTIYWFTSSYTHYHSYHIIPFHSGYHYHYNILIHLQFIKYIIIYSNLHTGKSISYINHYNNNILINIFYTFIISNIYLSIVLYTLT